MIKNTNTRGRNTAFTLVELLVVVSIIALLIAILLPSLKRARQSAKRVACNANLRSVAQAGLTYASDDPQEMSIPISPGDVENGAESRSYTSYIGYGGKSGQGASSPFGGDFRLDSRNRPLNYVLYKSGFGGSSTQQSGRTTTTVYDAGLELDVYRCPGDKGFPGMHHAGWKESGLTAYDYYGTAYSANPLYIGTGPGSILSSNAIYSRPMSRVPSPSDTVLYWEYAARYAFFMSNSEEYDQSGCFWPYSDMVDAAPADGHHGQPWHFNVSFGDGHATWIKIRGHGRVQDSRVKSNLECVVVRGLGWRIDTLPAEPVVTRKIWGGGSNNTINTQDGGSTDIFAVVGK